MSSVLIVDDEKNIRKTLSIGLKRYQYDVKEALNGLEALEVMKKSPCDFVISDIRMSPMDGYALASELHTQYPKVNVILISAYDFDDNKVQCKEIISYPKLTKPFSIPDLIKMIKREEEKGKKIKIVAFGLKSDEEKLYKRLEEENFYITLYDCDTLFCQHLQTESYDLIIIDEIYLNCEEWKLLNRIDQYAPEKPVILLTSPEEEKNYIEAPDLGVAVMDKALFINKWEKAVRFLRKHMHRSIGQQNKLKYSDNPSINLLDIQEEQDA